ncbi:MAG: ankyrin repeat domain-containing protein [Planctomycetota bacterium]
MALLDALANTDFVRAQAVATAWPAVLKAETHGDTVLVYVLDSSPYRSNGMIYSHRDEIIPWLLDHGADVNGVTSQDMTPLLEAMLCRDAASVRLLLDHGADISLQPPGREVPLPILAAFIWDENTFIIPLLVQHGADLAAVDALGSGIGHYAADAHDALAALKEVARLHPQALDASSRDGETPLFWLMKDWRMRSQKNPSQDQFVQEWEKKRAAAEFLLDHGADVHRVLADGRSLLDYAVETYNLDMVQRAVEAGVMVNATRQEDIFLWPKRAFRPGERTRYPVTALDEEILWYFDYPIADYLLNHGATSSGDLDLGGTARSLIDCAREDTDRAIDNSLDQNGGNPTLPPVDLKKTSLYLLLSHHWDPNLAVLQGDEGKEQVFGGEPRLEVFKLLLQYGLDPNIRNAEGDTLLHWCARDVLEALNDRTADSRMSLLLKYGANPRIRNSAGDTALEVATSCYYRYGGPGFWFGSWLHPGHHNTSYTMAVLYGPTQGPTNVCLWLGLVLGLAAVLLVLGWINRRRTKQLLAGGADAVPEAIWNSVQWQTLAPAYQRGQTLYAAGLRHRLNLLSAPLLVGFLIAVHRIDPLVKWMIHRRDWIHLAVLGVAFLALYGLLYVPWRRLRLTAALLAFATLFYTALLFFTEGRALVWSEQLYAVGWLLIAGAGMLTAGLFHLYRFMKCEWQVAQLKLPQRPGERQKTPEGEVIKAATGWDQTQAALKAGSEPQQPML